MFARIIYKISDLTALENPEEYVIARLFKMPRRIRFRNGFEIRVAPDEISRANTLIELAHLGAEFAWTSPKDGTTWTVSPNRDFIETPSGVRVSLGLADSSVLAETFLYETHFYGHDLAGCDVIDVGANVGDTALYFASKGARVFAFEPDPENFQELQANLVMNPNLAGKILPYNLAVGHDGQIPFWSGQRSGSSAFGGPGRPIQVESISLETLLTSIGLRNAFLLKADCKGCEAELVEQAAISRFAHVQIEYTQSGSRGDVNRIREGLRGHGFTNVRQFKHNHMPLPLRRHGLLRADWEPKIPLPR